MIDNNSSTREDRGATPEPSGLPFSRYVSVGDWIFVSGVVGRDPKSGNMDRQSIREQTHAALRVIEEVLGDAEACLRDVVKATVYVTDLERFGELNDAYREVFGSECPARTCVEVSRLPDPEALMEIDVIAHRQWRG